jgi:hypothetical protein
VVPSRAFPFDVTNRMMSQAMPASSEPCPQEIRSSPSSAPEPRSRGSGPPASPIRPLASCSMALRTHRDTAGRGKPGGHHAQPSALLCGSHRHGVAAGSSPSRVWRGRRWSRRRWAWQRRTRRRRARGSAAAAGCLMQAAVQTRDLPRPYDAGPVRPGASPLEGGYPTCYEASSTSRTPRGRHAGA